MRKTSFNSLTQFRRMFVRNEQVRRQVVYSAYPVHTRLFTDVFLRIFMVSGVQD